MYGLFTHTTGTFGHLVTFRVYARHDTSRARVARAVFTTRDDRCAGDDDPTRRARGEDDAHRSFDRASTARDVARDAETRSNARAVDRARARAPIASDGSRDARDRRAMTRAR